MLLKRIDEQCKKLCSITKEKPSLLRIPRIQYKNPSGYLQLDKYFNGNEGKSSRRPRRLSDHRRTRHPTRWQKNTTDWCCLWHSYEHKEQRIVVGLKDEQCYPELAKQPKRLVFGGIFLISELINETPPDSSINFKHLNSFPGQYNHFVVIVKGVGCSLLVLNQL